MIADGNGVGSNYAIRLFRGQSTGGYGDEHVLPYEMMPHVALVKTYNVNAQPRFRRDRNGSPCGR